MFYNFLATMNVTLLLNLCNNFIKQFVAITFFLNKLMRVSDLGGKLLENQV